MSSDIKLNGNNIVLEGSVGVGTNNPVRPLHVEGNEIHSGGPGAGFSFSDRHKPGLVNNPTNAERWVWYAAQEAARLWSGEDIMTVGRMNNSWRTQLKGRLHVEGSTEIDGNLRADRLSGMVGIFSGQEMGSQKLKVINCVADAIRLHKGLTSGDTGFALLHDFDKATNKDALVINYQGSYKNGVRIDSNVQVNGVLTQASSIALKENVAQLSTQEAITALQGLSAVRFNYKADEKKEQHVGFIAEEVPDLVATTDRKSVSSMDIVGVLTKVVQEQQRMLADLTAEVTAMKTARPRSGQVTATDEE